MGRTQYILLAVVLALAGFSVWMLNVVNVPKPGAPPGPRHIPDYYLDDFTATAMGTDGKPLYRLKADHLDHYQDNDLKVITHLHLQWFRPGLPDWTVDADEGRILNHNRLVLLQGRVVMVRAASADQASIRLETRDLTLRPDEKYAETETAVTIRSGPNRIDAVGMHVDLEAGRVDLLANVRGHYATPQP
ncbi:MAG: LPS export ABC transporter periplasmic protein LptC [Gammaproteobacteria bacterium]